MSEEMPHFIKDKPPTVKSHKTTNSLIKLSKPQLVDIQLLDKAWPKKSLPNKSQSNLELNTFHSKRNTSSTIKSKESKEFHMKEKSLNMKKLPELKEFQSKELSLIIMPLKLKLNTFQKKSKRPS